MPRRNTSPKLAIRQKDGLAAIREWEAQFGALTEGEMAEARQVIHRRGGGTRRRRRTRSAGGRR
jgi:hypothetical protein